MGNNANVPVCGNCGHSYQKHLQQKGPGTYTIKDYEVQSGFSCSFANCGGWIPHDRERKRDLAILDAAADARERRDKRRI